MGRKKKTDEPKFKVGDKVTSFSWSKQPNMEIVMIADENRIVISNGIIRAIVNTYDLKLIE